MISAIIGGIVSLVTGTVNGWTERQKVKLENEVAIERARAEAEVARLTKIVDAEINWDYEALRQGEKSWKDEYWTVILSIPLILVFIPGMESYILTGFKHLDNVPEWYRYAVGIAIGAAFGFRQLTNLMSKRR